MADKISTILFITSVVLGVVTIITLVFNLTPLVGPLLFVGVVLFFVNIMNLIRVTLD